MTRDLARYIVAAAIGAAVLWALTCLFIFALGPEVGTP